MKLITVATEDELSEAVACKLASEAGFSVGQRLRRNGFGYLKSRMANFCQISRRQDVLLITDLDRVLCPADLVNNWTRGLHVPSEMIFRVAVREIESWLLADHMAISAFMGEKVGPPPENPDSIQDPKQVILNMARRAPRQIRDELLPPHGAIASQGFGYNSKLCAFVRDSWIPERAAHRSGSLAKTRVRLLERFGN